MVFEMDLLMVFENIVGKGENAGYQHYLLFPLFSKAIYVNTLNCVGKT